MADKGFDEEVLGSFRTDMMNAMGNRIQGVLLEPLLEDAYRRKDVTAWVGANDHIALRAVEFLSARGVRVPEDISVAGFDNTHAAFQGNLSSYDFNAPGIVHRLLEHVVGPARAGVRNAAGEPSEIEGMVIERMTTARARKR
jgi:DNA-binding LacI/PurR family transcriptional regulator